MKMIQSMVVCLLVLSVSPCATAAGTVTIGTQEWTSNLDVAQYRNGTAVPLATDDRAWRAAYKAAQPMSRYLSDDPANGGRVGRLYNWHAVNAGDLCPDGFRIPSIEDWQALVAHVGGEAQAAKALKAKDDWGVDPETGLSANGTDAVGFRALPGFQARSQGGFAYVPATTVFWSSTAAADTASVLHLGAGDAASIGNPVKEAGFSVRCVRAAGG